MRVAAERSTLRRDTRYVAVSATQIVALALGTPVLARLLSQRSFGEVTGLVALEQLLVAVMSLGMVGGAQRTYFRHSPRHARELITISSALIAALVCLLAVLAPRWDRFATLGVSSGTVALTVAWAGCAAATQIAAYALRAKDSLQGFALAFICQNVGCQAAAIILVGLGGRSPQEVITGYLASQALALVVAWAYFRPATVRRTEWGVHARIVRSSVSLVPQALSFFLLSGIDRLMIESYLGPGAVARYQVAYNLGSVTLVFANYFHQAWETRAFEESRLDRRLVQTARSRDELIAIFALVVVATGWAGPSVLRVWAPGGYSLRGLDVVLVLVSAASIPLTAALAQCRLLMAEGRMSATVAGAAAAAVVVVAANAVLIPALGLAGAALSLLVAMAAMDAVLRTRLRDLRQPQVSGQTRRIVAISGACALVSLAAPTWGPWLAVRLAVGAVPGAWAVLRLRELHDG